MPEFTVKEVRLPELHLPEIKRDQIVRSLSGVRFPEIDLAKARRASVKIPTVTLTSSDVGKLLAAATAVARFVRPAPRRGRWLTGLAGRRTRSPVARIVTRRSSRSRRPLALGAIVLAMVGGWVLLRRPAVRQRVEATARRARNQLDEVRARAVGSEAPADEPIAFTAAATAPIQAEAYTGTTEAGAIETAVTDYPDGLGSSTVDTNGSPAFEESNAAG